MSINDNELDLLVSADDLYTELNETKDHPECHITIINVLAPRYFEDCRIKDSINIDANVIGDYVQDWDRTRFIVVHGASDDLTASRIAFQKLYDMGFSNVRILIGGMVEWLDDGYPSEGACQMDYLQ